MSRFAHWFARRATASRGARKPSLPHTRRIGVERLEDRAVPATLSISDATLTEGNSGQKDFVFTVTLSEASGESVTVQYATAEGTALDNTDFQRIPNGSQALPTLTFAPGETSKSVTVRVKGETTPELDESFFVNLSNPVNATILDGQGVGTILNDDSIPIANPDSYSVGEDTQLTIGATGVLANDTAPGNPLAAELVSGPAHGILTLNADGSFTYTPLANYNGTDTFTYRADDGTLESAAATVTITINPVNDAPSLTLGSDQSVPEDSGAQTVSGWASGMSAGPADEAGQQLEILLSTDNLALFAVAPAVAADGTLTFTPAAGANGQATVTVVLRDDGGTANGGADTSPIQSFTITVSPVNDTPESVGDSYSTAEDTPLTIGAAGVLGNDTDPDGDPLSAVLLSGPSHGSLTLNADGSITYTPAADYSGPDSFTYLANDGQAGSNAATVTLTVNPVNDAPVLTGGADLDEVAEAETNPPGQSVTALLAGLVSDADSGNPLTGIAVVGNPLNAEQGTWQYSTDDGTTWFDIGTVADTTALALAADAKLRFMPALGFSGEPAPLGVRAIDSTFTGTFTVDGTRASVDATTTGGSTPFSAATAAIGSPVYDVAGAWLSTTGNLYVTGTSGNDTIIVRPATLGRVVVVLNGSLIGTFSRAQVTGRLRVRGLDGQDHLRVALGLANPADLFGGAGNDILWGGIRADRLFGEGGNDRLYGRRSHDVLIGGDGNDTVGGGLGVDVLIGGAGADVLQGWYGSDLLVAGATDFDQDATALSVIAAEWASSSDYTDRIAHLSGPTSGLNGTTFLTANTVHDDAALDILRGSYGLDWFWLGALDQFVLGGGEFSAGN